MKIKVIGSGSMWTKNNSASYLIDDNIIVDIPNGMCKNLFKLGINPKAIRHVLITHFHGDHYFDIPFYFLMKSRAEDKNINVYCSKEGKKKNNALLKLAFPNSRKDIIKEINLKYICTDTFKVNYYIVTKYLMDHGRMKPAFGYVFENKKTKIGFTGDTAICKNVLYMANICDYLFCDCSLIKSTDKHMGIDNIKYLSKTYPNCKFVVSHLDDDTREELKKLKIKNVIISSDGLELTI